jgi:predicted regulator of Ras-like GTPase activity (Roadblock/LC7/MglB family)
MRKVLEPLGHVPGVRRAMLISRDGVPIVTLQGAAAKAGESSAAGWQDSADDANAFAGLATGWLTEVQRAVDPMSWNTPVRLVLAAARGTLILLVSERATLSVELERGMAAEELRLPMEAALARMQRALRRREDRIATADSTKSGEIPGIFPGQRDSRVDGETLPEAGVEHASVQALGLMREHSGGSSPQGEMDPAAGSGRNEATGNEVP